MSAFLPHRDPDPEAREEAIRAAQNDYKYSYTHVSPLAVVENVPFRDEFSFAWLTNVAERLMVGLANRAELEVLDEHREHHHTHRGLFSRLIHGVENAVLGLKHVVADALKFDGRFGAAPLPAKSLEDYSRLFRTIGLPPVAKGYQDDRVFAQGRLAGPNPVMLRVLNARDPRLPLSDADFAIAVPGDSFDAALAEGRLFLADYSALEGAEHGTYPHGQKYVYAPLALFVLDRPTRVLLPVAIQCKQQPAADNPIFIRSDGYNWLIAKTIVEIADGNVHEAATHLGRTHLLMEPFVVSTFRQFAPNHPLGLLLGPHFEGTLAINSAAWQHLIAEKGAADKLFGASITSTRGLTAQSIQSARVHEVMLPKTLSMRGVADPSTLPDYPYRDDALLYWEAIREWVTAYLTLYYDSPLDVVRDDELQHWARELAARDGGRISGLPHEGEFREIAELIEVVTLILFTCSVQHAAVNFPQYDLMSYAPNMPLASYRPAPTSKSGATEADYLAMLPPMDMAELQMELGYVLGTVRYTQLGHYQAGHFRDARVKPHLQRFQQRIEEIGRVIDERNLTRRPYPFLTPAGIPQSINV